MLLLLVLLMLLLRMLLLRMMLKLLLRMLKLLLRMLLLMMLRMLWLRLWLRLRLRISHYGNSSNLGLPCQAHRNLVSIRMVVITQSPASIVFASVQDRATALLLPMNRRPSWDGG